MTIRSILLTTAAVMTFGATAQAAQVAALVGDDTIAIVDTAAKKATKSMKVTGISGAIVGIDLADPGFWDAGLDLVERQLTAAEEAARAARGVG